MYFIMFQIEDTLHIQTRYLKFHQNGGKIKPLAENYYAFKMCSTGGQVDEISEF